MPKAQLIDTKVSWDGAGRVFIRDANLLTNLIEDGKKAAAEEISKQVSPISADAISIDEFGAVVIHDKAFLDKVNSLMFGPGGLGDTNVVGCPKANIYKCSGIAVEEA